MMNKTFILALAAILISAGSILSQELGLLKLNNKLSAGPKYQVKFNPGKIDINSSASVKNDFAGRIDADIKNDKLTMNNIKRNISPDVKKKKSPFLGAMMSALIPGSGELYGGNILKAAIFFGLEAVGWGVYAYLRHKGDTKTTEFQNYAEQYWDIHKYADWLKSSGFPSSGGINPNETDWNTLRAQIMVCEQANFSHTLPERYSQQFYELIGKYQNFQAGWTNLAHDPTKQPGPYYYETYRDQIFVDYAFTRQKANDYYNYASDGVYIIVLNHLLSAADAAWTVSTFNKKLKMQTGFRMTRSYSPLTLKYENIPTFNMAVTF